MRATHPFFLLDTPAAIRTRDLQLRRLTLYPAELRVRTKFKIHRWADAGQPHAPSRVSRRESGKERAEPARPEWTSSIWLDSRGLLPRVCGRGMSPQASRRCPE